MEFAQHPLIYRIASIINANQIQACQLDLTFIEFEIHEISIEVFFESARHKNWYPHLNGFQSAQIDHDNELSKNHLVEIHPFMDGCSKKENKVKTSAFLFIQPNKDKIIYTIVCN